MLLLSAAVGTTDDEIATAEFIRVHTESALEGVAKMFKVDEVKEQVLAGKMLAASGSKHRPTLLDHMSDTALSHLQSASTSNDGVPAAQLFPGVGTSEGGGGRGGRGASQVSGPRASGAEGDAEPKGKVTFAALQPGHDFHIPGILEPDRGGARAGSQAGALFDAYKDGTGVGSASLSTHESAADRLAAAYGAYDDGTIGRLDSTRPGEDRKDRQTPGWDPRENIRRHSREYVELNRMGLAHTEAYTKQKEGRHAAWHAQFKRAIKAAETPEALAAQAARLRRMTASKGAQRFHSQLAKAQETMRQPLGATVPVHSSPSVVAHDAHCWQPHAAYPATDAGDEDLPGGPSGRLRSHVRISLAGGEGELQSAPPTTLAWSMPGNWWEAGAAVRGGANASLGASAGAAGAGAAGAEADLAHLGRPRAQPNRRYVDLTLDDLTAAGEQPTPAPWPRALERGAAVAAAMIASVNVSGRATGRRPPWRPPAAARSGDATEGGLAPGGTPGSAPSGGGGGGGFPGIARPAAGSVAVLRPANWTASHEVSVSAVRSM